MRRLALLAGATLAVAMAAPAWATSGDALAKPAPARSTADARLRALYDGYARWDAGQGCSVADKDGEWQAGACLPRVDAATQQMRLRHLDELQRQLAAIPVASLSSEEQVNAAVFKTVLDNGLIELRDRTYEMPFNSDSNFWTYLDARQPFKNAEGYRRYIGRLNDIPRYFSEQEANMDAGLARGFSVPKATLDGRDQSIAVFLEKPAADSAFYAPFRNMPSTITAAEQEELRKAGLAAIQNGVLPAYGKLLAYYRDTYYPKARATVSAHDLPDGDAFYRDQVREYTTTDLTPEQIHQIGLSEVARIEAGMREQMRASGFKGDLPAFLTFLKTDPQFYAKTPDELMGVSAYVAKRVDGKLDEEFHLLPRRRFTIIPVPDALAPFYTAGRGGLDSCMMNTYNLPTRPLYNIPALTLHECGPGHSFQAALSTEQKDLPKFRQNLYFSGYGEGWGLYSEWLGNEMGIYRTPYEKFGQLSYEMWRAARLVIDTGIHRYGWTRSQAIDYLASHTALSQHEVETEVDRYISWPGQALSYKLGELTIRRLRKEAEDTLGSKFDKAAFHDRFLSLGAVPLNVLEEQMREWIKAQQRTASKS